MDPTRLGLTQPNLSTDDKSYDNTITCGLDVLPVIHGTKIKDEKKLLKSSTIANQNI